MNFGDALTQLHAGNRVARAGWNGQGQWLILVPGSTITVTADRPLGIAAPNLVGQSVTYGPHIDIYTADGTLVPWVASQTDQLADDWTAVASPRPKMLVGDAYAIDRTRYPGQTIGMVFNPPGAGLNIAKVKAVPPDVVLIVCVKDIITDQMLNDLMDARGSGLVWLVEHQEPEGDLPPADYIAQQQALAALIATHPKAAQITQVGKLTRWAETHGKGPWSTWFAGRPGKPVERVMAWDMYVDDTSATYPAYADFAAPAIAAAVAAGVPLAITELGVRRLAYDPDGSKLIAWMRGFVDYLRTQTQVQVLAVLWWDGPGSKSDYTLHAPERAAWAQIVATQ